MPKKKQAKKFMYGVGFYWEGAGEGYVSLYAYGSDVFYGTMEQARNFRDYCQNQPDNKGKNRREYKIFQLVEIPE
jgi:hypothetical protein